MQVRVSAAFSPCNRTTLAAAASASHGQERTLAWPLLTSDIAESAIPRVRLGSSTVAVRRARMPMTTRRWLRGPLLGVLLGLPILGGGGRLAMHAIALTSDAQRVVSVEGTITVLLAGALAGLAGGMIYALLDRVLPQRRF